MAKTEATVQLERAIYNATRKMGTFCCFEVTIGIGGSERVDYITYDTKKVWRCFEIKTSVADFRSKAKKSFVGHLNYFVLTKEVYEKVKDEVPKHVGVYVNGMCRKRAKKQQVTPEMHETLTMSMIRSLSREAEKVHNSENVQHLAHMKRMQDHYQKEAQEARRSYNELGRQMRDKYGRDYWR
jgi:hypothetical protein